MNTDSVLQKWRLGCWKTGRYRMLLEENSEILFFTFLSVSIRVHPWFIIALFRIEPGHRGTPGNPHPKFDTEFLKACLSNRRAMLSLMLLEGASSLKSQSG